MLPVGRGADALRRGPGLDQREPVGARRVAVRRGDAVRQLRQAVAHGIVGPCEAPVPAGSARASVSRLSGS